MKTVRMEVNVTVEPPEGHDLPDERAIELAMSAVTQFHEVMSGRNNYGSFAWAKVYAEVCDHDCEIID